MEKRPQRQQMVTSTWRAAEITKNRRCSWSNNQWSRSAWSFYRFKLGRGFLFFMIKCKSNILTTKISRNETRYTLQSHSEKEWANYDAFKVTVFPLVFKSFYTIVEIKSHRKRNHIQKKRRTTMVQEKKIPFRVTTVSARENADQWATWATEMTES